MSMSALENGPLASLSTCALICLEEAIAKSTCDLTDIHCMCTNKDVTAYLTTCLEKTCTVKEILVAQNGTYTQCGIKPSVDYSYVPVMTILTTLAAAFVGLRCLARVLVSARMWWDDLFNFAALLVCIAYTAVSVKLKDGGFGTDMWAVPLENITTQLKAYYGLMFGYIAARNLVRISIIMFYIRIFPVSSARTVMIATLISTIVAFLPFTICTIFLCDPISYEWTRWDGEHKGHCLNAYALLWSGWVVLLVNDLMIIAAPLPFILRLQLTLGKKVLVSLMFGAGFIVVAISAYKLSLIRQYTQTQNPTYDEVQMATWAAVEMDIGVICACMPSMPALFRPLWRMIRGKDMKTNIATGYGGPGSRYDVISTSGNKKNKLFTSTASSMPPTGSGGLHEDDYHIQMITTIQQTHGRSESQTDLNQPSTTISSGEQLHLDAIPPDFKVQTWVHTRDS